MLSDDIRAYLLPQAFNAAVRAGWEIMEVYKSRESYDISVKSDSTPITLADRLAHEKIKESLGQTRIPILSEEGREMLYDERRNWELFWLVDPLDGTVEFIKGNNEFTVNIALMLNRICVCAVVYVPYLEKAYVASREVGSFLIEGVAPSADAAYSYEDICARKQRLPLESSNHSSYRIASRISAKPLVLSLGCGIYRFFQAIYVLYDSHKFYRIVPDIPVFFLLTVNPMQVYPFF